MMKKRILILSCCLICFFTACSNQNIASGNTEPEGASSQTSSQVSGGESASESGSEAEETIEINWQENQEYDFDNIELVYSIAKNGFVEEPIYLIQQNDIWSFWNTSNNSKTSFDNAFTTLPFLDDLDLISGTLEENEKFQENYEGYCEVSQNAGLPWQISIGHGVVEGSWAIYNNNVCWYSTNPGYGGKTPLEQQKPTTLIGVQTGAWEVEPEIDPNMEFFYPDENSFAVADQNGTILTEHHYQNVCSATENLIAVQSNDLWGYCNAKGEMVIPCEYIAPQMQPATQLFPYPEIGGLVVLKTSDNQYTVMNIHGETIVEAGAFEKITPSVTEGEFFAQKNGVWGTLDLTGFVL